MGIATFPNRQRKPPERIFLIDPAVVDGDIVKIRRLPGSGSDSMLCGFEIRKLAMDARRSKRELNLSEVWICQARSSDVM